MFLKRSSMDFFTFMMIAVISEYGLEAMNALDRIKTRSGELTRRHSFKLDSPRSGRATTSDGAIDAENVYFDAVVKFLEEGTHICSGCVTVITDKDNKEYPTVAVSETCWKDIQNADGNVEGWTIEGVNIKVNKEEKPLAKSNSVIALRIPTNQELLKPVHLAPNKLNGGKEGIAATWPNGKLFLKRFPIVDGKKCGQKSSARFCVHDSEDVGIGSPIFIEGNGIRYLAGVQSHYALLSGNNVYIAVDDTFKYSPKRRV